MEWRTRDDGGATHYFKAPGASSRHSHSSVGTVVPIIPCPKGWSLADVDTLKCAAVRNLRRRTKVPKPPITKEGVGTCRERVCPKLCNEALVSPAAATWGDSPTALQH